MRASPNSVAEHGSLFSLRAVVHLSSQGGYYRLGSSSIGTASRVFFSIREGVCLMKKLLTFMCSAVLVASLAGVAGAVIYPPGPTGTCLDSITITQIQDPTSLCNPVATDTVYGVRGIVNAVDSIAGAYGLYAQLKVGGPYSGIDVFTSSVNYQGPVPGTASGGNIFYGDLIAMDGVVAEFNGLTEINRFSAVNGMAIRRVSSNNGFPPYHIGTPLELDWVPGWVSANGSAAQEQWEGCLVKVHGPLVCGRTLGNGIGSRSNLLSAPGGLDSLCADGFSLTNIAALAVGTPVDSVQGVFSQVTINAINSYRILLRNLSDLFASAPPNVIDAYPVADNLLRIILDRPVTAASAQDLSHYSLASFGTIDSAVLEAGGKSVLVGITNGLSHGDGETVTVSGLTAVSGGLTMTSGQPRTFFNGVLSIAEIQQPAAAGLGGAPCHDYSRFTGAAGITGSRLTYTGIVTADFTSLFYMQDATGTSRNAFAIFAPPAPLTVGHKYLIAGAVQEFDGISGATTAGFTEGVSTQYIRDLGAAAVPAPVVQTVDVLRDTTCDAAQTALNAEDYEGSLVTIKYARVIEDRTAGQDFLIVGWHKGGTLVPDTMLVKNFDNDYTYAAESLHTVQITGVMAYRNGGFPWRITPRSESDIVDLGLNALLGVGPSDNGSDDLRLLVSPNPSPTSRVKFTLAKSGKVDLGVFDLSGRRLATLLNGNVPAGDYSQRWNGLDSNGARVRSGVYFYRLRTAEKTVTSTAIKLD